MENSKASVQLEEISIDKVCRTCLSTSDEAFMISLFDSSEGDLAVKFNYFDLINETFGRIMPLSQNLPSRLCSQCQGVIRKAFDFKKQCLNSTQILSEAIENDVTIFGAEDKYTQTDHQILQMQFDDEHFDTINLQEDVIFESSQANPLSVLDSAISQESSNNKQPYEESYAKEEEHIEVDYVNSQLEEAKTDESANKLSDYELNEQDSDENKQKVCFQCDKCSKKFTRLAHLKRHKMIHEEEKSMFCTICNKGFTRLDHLNHHMLNAHSDSKPFSCDVADCKKSFLKEDLLKKHIEAKHTEGSKDKEVCSICQKTFSSKKYLKTHMKVHNVEKPTVKKDPQNEKPFLCSECGLRFVRNDYLVIHMRRHLGVKPYKCKFCDKGFPRATDLTVHERYHTNEKTHLCNLCGKGFQRAYNLLVHMRVHTGEKPYSCSYCSKSFSQGNDLKAHIRRHTGERFKCDLCSEGFIQGYHLRNHKKTVHGIDVKSHIRRVEKFVNPAVLSTTDNVIKDQQILPENEQEVKVEVEYQFTVK